jgi:hypothetical protein
LTLVGDGRVRQKRGFGLSQFVSRLGGIQYPVPPPRARRQIKEHAAGAHIVSSEQDFTMIQFSRKIDTYSK